jgi:nicotinate-nucleotide adenylyltransferase
MLVAEQVQLRLSLDEVHFLPCAIPVHRDIPRISDANRIRMIELAIAGNSRFRLNTLELDRGGKSYTIDTLRALSSANQSVTLNLILGADAFNQFPGWRSPDDILQLANLVICRRPGVELDKSIYASHWVDSAQLLRDRARGCILPLEMDENHCSSTLVRQLLLEKNSAARCLPAAVFQYIASNHLYEQIP